MKTLVLVATVVILVGLTSNAEDEPQSAYELAPQLENLKESHPEEYRILADGTFDTLPLDERLRIAERLMIPNVDAAVLDDVS